VLEIVDPLDDAKLKASIEKHSSGKDVPFKEYVRTRKIELGKNVTQHKLIYLDTRYWIILREAFLGRRPDHSSVRLLDYLRLHARKHGIICPISESVFIELLKQQDLRTRRKTAELIDELSLGVTLASEPERIGTEFAHFFYSHDDRSSVYPLKWLIWTKLSCVFGDMYPTNTGLSQDRETVMQKVCYDHIWDCSLTEIVDTLGDKQPPLSDFKELASSLNVGIAKFSHKIQSFQQVFAKEFEGGLSIYMPEARKILEDKYEQNGGVMPINSEAEQKEIERQLLSFFVQTFQKKESARLFLPTLYIYALCHASVRWDKSRKLKGNDFYDFHHAAAAIAYCDVFLTESPLRTLLQANHLKINQYFKCRIISSISEAVDCLENE
jgi:hypothetical protein